MPVNVSDIRRVIGEVYPRIVELRRDLHRRPEIAYEEVGTAARVSAELKKLGIPHRTKVGGTGVVALIRGARPGKCLALRADMDALPLAEPGKSPWRSEVPGKMHACGHDGHTANLVGVAHVLSRMREHVRGSVKLLFQPAEEGGGGAHQMIRQGALRNPRPDVVYALHTGPAVALGKVAWRTGPISASTTSVDILFHGKGAHAAAPHRSVDPIVMAAQFLQAVQTVASRRVDPLDEIVLTFGTFHAGTARNVIPGDASLLGTLRAYRDSVRNLAAREVRRIARNIARSAGGWASVDIAEGYPAVVNDARAAAFLGKVAVETLGKSNVVEAEAGMGGEDFSFFLAESPGALFRLGNGTPEIPLHSPHFRFDDRALRTGMLVMSALALRWLEAH